MFRLSISARNSLLAVGAVLALFVAFKSDADGDAPAARIPAAKRRTASKPKPAPVPRKDRLIGDASLLGEINLEKRKLVDDHYETRLPDGSQAVLTLDPKWQKAAEKVLAQAKAPQASIVVMKPDGTILALAAGRFQNNSVQHDASLGLSTWAPAASIFKVVTASSLLANGLPAKKEVCYHGGLRSVEPSNLIDNPRADGTCNSLEFGVAKSQNALMAKLVTKFLKQSELRKTANAFGFGKAPHFALEAQASTVTLPPRIVSEVRERGRTIPVVSTEPERVLEKKLANTVAEMMSATVRYGTAKKAFRDPRGRPYMKDTTIAGKTGSLSTTSPEYIGYSWFVGFAPVEEPEVVISVLLGNPAKWHLKAHTAARLVLDSHF